MSRSFAFSERTNGADARPLADAALAALHRTGHGWLRRIVVEIDGGAIVLRGQVPSYYLKQLAQVTVLAVPGVEVVRNDLQVIHSPQAQQ